MQKKSCDVVIVGGGVTGTALAYVLSGFTNVERIALIEKYPRVAQVNSDPRNNSQTSHDGGTETNYDLEHALTIKAAAVALRRYVERKGRGLFRKTHRMVIGVGREEVRLLEERFETFKDAYPDLRLIRRDELKKIEPKVIEGRDPHEPICALISTEGYAINYQKLSESFLADAQKKNSKIDTFFNTKVRRVRREDGIYVIETDSCILRAKVVVFAAGAAFLFWMVEMLTTDGVSRRARSAKLSGVPRADTGFVEKIIRAPSKAAIFFMACFSFFNFKQRVFKGQKAL